MDEDCERVGESSHRRAWLWPSHMTGTVGGGCHRYGYDQRQGEAARLARASLGEDLLSGSSFELHSGGKVARGDASPEQLVFNIWMDL